jgi:hypothetical protein
MDVRQCERTEPHKSHVYNIEALFISCPGVVPNETAQQAADRLYPPNHPVDDPEGETGEAQSDPYGYDEIGRRAFMEGVAWQLEHGDKA